MENEEALIAENPLKEETEEKEIACKTCRFVLPPVQIWGALHERFSFNSCEKFENKPEGILTKGDKCPLFKKREEK